MDDLALDGARYPHLLGEIEPVEGVPAPFMRAVELPPGDPDELWGRLYEDFRIEAPVYGWDDRCLLRISIGPYNDDEDVERLVSALRQLL